MSEETVLTDISPEPLPEGAETIPEPVELPELIHEYQPTDESGRPIGGKQVLKYKTTDELVGKIQQQNVLLTRKLREVTRKNRLGISDPESIPEEVKRFPTPLEFKERALTVDERVKLYRDASDPERFLEANDEIFEARFGAKPQQLTKTMQDMQQEILNLKVKNETDAFLRNNPDYYVCQENGEAITGWMVKNHLDPLQENFQLAYDTLKSSDVIIRGGAPIAPVAQVDHLVAQVAVPVAQPVPTAPTEQLAEPPATVRISSGLTRNQAGDAPATRAVGDDIIYQYVDPHTKEKRVYKGMAALEAMPSEEYKNRLRTDPNFSKTVDKLETEAAANRVNRRPYR